jgi:hypothetical protein
MTEEASRSANIYKSKFEVLKSQIADEVNHFKKRRDKNKLIARSVYTCATLISTANTVVLGFQLAQPAAAPAIAHPAIRNAALIMSSLVTALVAYESFFNHRALWVRYAQTVCQLLSLQARIKYYSADGLRRIPDVDLDRFFEEFEVTLAQTNDWWQRARSEHSDKNVSAEQSAVENMVVSQ